MPALSVAPPVKVFAPESVHVPVPLLVSVPLVVAMTPLSTPVPVPSKFNPKVLPDTPPLKVNVPLPDALIVAPLPVKTMARLVELPVPVYRSIPVAPMEIAGVVDPVPREIVCSRVRHGINTQRP